MKSEIINKFRLLFLTIFISLFLVISGSNNVKAYSTISSNQIFGMGTLDSLWLNYSTLPQITVSGSVGNSVYDTPFTGNNVTTGYTYRRVELHPGGNGPIDTTITVNYYNCGTLNGRSINMKLVYSDLVVNTAEDCYLYWSAFGTNKISDNEWWYNGIEHAKVRIYFYYSDGSQITNLSNAYLSIFSEDENEGAKSETCLETYLYQNTSMVFKSVTSHIQTYYNVYAGTSAIGTDGSLKNCIAFTYNNVNYIEVELFGLEGKNNIGYHFEYTPLTATLPNAPVKSVNKTESELGDTLEYTVNQQISKRYDSSFTYSSLVFKDTIDSNLTYNYLKVYNENGADITASAGTTNYNSSTRELTYTFNSSWLNSMPYNGQNYRFVINTTVNSTSTSATITDRATTIINNSHTLSSNTVSTVLKAKVIVHYVNRQGQKLADDTTINGNLLDSYLTSAKDIYAYYLYSNSGNTVGTMQTNITEVTYIYDLIRVDINIDKEIEATDSTRLQKLKGARFKLSINEFAPLVSLASPEEDYFSTYTDEDGHYVISGVPYGNYTIIEDVVPSIAYSGIFYKDGVKDRITSFNIDINKNENLSYSLEDIAKKMQIKIYKEDFETGITTQGDAHLEGAEYTLYRNSNCTDAIETLTIAKNEDGTYSATSGWYLVGTYYVKETKAPEGYLIDEKVYTVSQNPEAQTTEYTTHTITSKDKVKRNDIEIIKDIGATSNTPQFPLDKCKFTATLVSSIGTDHEFSVECTAETNRNGYCIIENLPYGTYIVKETTVSPISLKCADFTVFVEHDKTEKTNPYVPKDGTFDAITLGEEIGTTKLYDTSYNWLNISGHIVDIPKVMQIKIRKVDEYATEENHQYTQGDAVIKGAIYEIYRYDPQTDAYTEYVYDITVDHIDEDGYWCAESRELLVGKYMVKEKIKSSKEEKDGKVYNYSYAEGYLVDEKEYYFESKPDEQEVRKTYHSDISTEMVIRGRVDAIKYNNNSVSTDKSPAEGAVLRLTLNKNPDIYYEGTINSKGYVEWVEEKSRDKYYPYTIPYGKYTISEVKASNSGEHTYIYNQQTEINYSTHTQNYIFSDEYVRMRLTIEKYDGETLKKLPNGATFKIWNVNNQNWYEEMAYPSGEFVSEFTTNDEGYITLNRHLEAGSYVLYETKAPEGYYLDEEMRVGPRGYEFSIGVEADGKVALYHNNERNELQYETIKYDNIPTKMYSHTIKINNISQKAVVEVEKLANQFTKVEIENAEFGNVSKPIFEERGLAGAKYRLIAAEDIVTPDGTTRYTKGQIVSNVTTGADGKGKFDEVYLGKYLVEEVSVPNGYVLDTTPIEINIEYTNQYEKVQDVKQTIRNEKQEVKLEFEKEFEELTVSKFKIENQEATFGIYSDETIKNYKNENTIEKDELVDIIIMDENHIVKNNIELPEGKYYVKELYVSNPYSKLNDKFNFSVEYTNTSDNPINVTINNGKVTNVAKTVEFELLVYPDVVFDELNIKDIVDRDDLEELAKVYGITNKVYGVYNDKECSKPVITIDDKEATFETNEDGIINIPDMPTGTYYFKELQAPYGYDLSDEVIKAEINENNSVIILKAKEPTKKANLLQKFDSFTKDTISGVKFEITDKEDAPVYTGVTNEDGIVQIPIIFFENGETYYYKEVETSSTYKIDENKYEFVAKYDEEKCEWTLDIINVVNNRKTIDFVKIIKKDSKTGETLEGCVFTIVLLDENGEEYVNANDEKIYLVENVTTNENGEYVIENVPYGTYKFVEMVAPEGYEIDEDMTGLTFVADDDTKDGIIFEVTNTGDIAVVTIAIVGVICILGIVFVILRNRKNK